MGSPSDTLRASVGALFDRWGEDATLWPQGVSGNARTIKVIVDRKPPEGSGASRGRRWVWPVRMRGDHATLGNPEPHVDDVLILKKTRGGTPTVQMRHKRVVETRDDGVVIVEHVA